MATIPERTEPAVRFKSIVTTDASHQSARFTLRLPRETILALIAVAIFSGTMPATRIAVHAMSPWITSMGRTILAGTVCLLILAVRKERFLERRHWPSVLKVALGALIGFPLFSSLGLVHSPASHGSAIVGLVPAATSAFAAYRSRQWPGWSLVAGSALGTLSVLAFAFRSGHGSITPSDVFLLLSILSAAYGYVEGGRLARIIGGWNTICWGMAAAAPLSLCILFLSGHAAIPVFTLNSAAALLYISFGSLLVGMFIWYKALAMGNMAKVAQVQLLQPIASVVLSCWLLHERPGTAVFLALGAVLICTGITQIGRTPSARAKSIT